MRVLDFIKDVLQIILFGFGIRLSILQQKLVEKQFKKLEEMEKQDKRDKG